MRQSETIQFSHPKFPGKGDNSEFRYPAKDKLDRQMLICLFYGSSPLVAVYTNNPQYNGWFTLPDSDSGGNLSPSPSPSPAMWISHYRLSEDLTVNFLLDFNVVIWNDWRHKKWLIPTHNHIYNSLHSYRVDIFSSNWFHKILLPTYLN